MSTTNMHALPYWVAVGDAEKEIRAKLSAGAYGNLHPAAGEDAVFIVSREHRLRVGHVAGRVVLARIRLAAKGLVDQTHEICTDTQISEHLASEAKRRDLLLAQERASSKNPSITFAAPSVHGPQGGK